MLKFKRLQTGNIRIRHLNYGPPGSGKTPIILTAPFEPLLIRVEKGTLSIKDSKIEYVDIETLRDLDDLIKFLLSDSKQLIKRLVVIDSLSRLLELKEQLTKGNSYAVYRLVAEYCKMIRAAIEDCSTHVYVTANEGIIGDRYCPFFIGKFAETHFQHAFDLVTRQTNGFIFTHSERDDFIARDRSGNLNTKEGPDLETIYTKVLGEKL